MGIYRLPRREYNIIVTKLIVRLSMRLIKSTSPDIDVVKIPGRYRIKNRIDDSTADNNMLREYCNK